MSMWHKSKSSCRARPFGTMDIFIRAASCCALTCSTQEMDGRQFQGDWCGLPETEGSVVSMQRARHSKDAGTLDSPVDKFSLLRPATSRSCCDASCQVWPSSVADNVFCWDDMFERAENTARIVRCMAPVCGGQTEQS